MFVSTGTAASCYSRAYGSHQQTASDHWGSQWNTDCGARDSVQLSGEFRRVIRRNERLHRRVVDQARLEPLDQQLPAILHAGRQRPC